ncbi:MAG TPA: single-stranded-DNA-specific exonuclease RecJ [Ktedonobacteraceae bacterium]|nr:single-stranded-DNA-specific exonuclease RecJ [Ktedonobacteraceae bacterium]
MEIALSPSWTVCAPLTRAEYEPFHAAGIEYLHAQLLYNRGLRSPEAMHSFLDARLDQIPDPFGLIDMQPAVERIRKALANGEHITVFGDFDADGVTSAALVTRVLRSLKQPDAIVDSFIPHRINDARGVSKDALDRLHGGGTSLIITTDCGSSDVNEAEYAQTLGLDIIITDHHHPPEQLPPVCAMINPWRPDCAYGERYLCGVGIAFKLAQALLRTYGRENEASKLLDLVAIGSVGDVAPLLGENHTLVRLGLRELNTTRKAGLKALIAAAGLQQGRIRERDISYMLAPRINAAGRMKHANIAFQLLVTDNEREARAYAQELEELNQARQQITEELMKLVRDQAQSQSNEQIVLVYGDKEQWPEGIIGLVAGRLSEEIKRPVFVLSQDAETSRGSARSYGDFNVIEALRHRADLFERHGGHAQAAGFTIANANIEELRRHLQAWKGQNGTLPPTPEDVIEDAASSALAEVVLEPGTISTDTRKIDMVITKPELINAAMYTRISLLSPYGAGNPEPTFRIDGMRLTRRWPSGNEGRNMRLRLRIGDVILNGTYFRAGSRVAEFPEGTKVNVIFCLEQTLNPVDYEGRQDVWLKVVDMQKA